MKKLGIITIYVPIELGSSEAVQAKNRQILEDDLTQLRTSELNNSFHIIIIHDSCRDQVEMDVFFNPYDL